VTTERIPILSFWNILLVPIQGEVHDSLALTLCEDVLGRVHRGGVHALVIDLTAAWMIDSHLCAVLSRLATSAALMGTRTVFSGMGPEAAMTVQTMGIEMPHVDTARTLGAALELIGVRRVVERDELAYDDLAADLDGLDDIALGGDFAR
jgi:rsbT antagonist protein RsbS